MSLVSLSRPALVRVNGRRMRPRPQGDVSALAIADAARHAQRLGQIRGPNGDGQKRAKLMLAAQANLHVSKKVPPGGFFIIDPTTMSEEDRAEAEEAGITSRTLALHPDDIDRALEHFEKEKGSRG